MIKLGLVNIFSDGRLLYVFHRVNDKLMVTKENYFFPYYYEEDKTGTITTYSGTKAKKIVVRNPWEIRDKKSDKSWEADVIYTRRYLVDNINIAPVRPRWIMMDIEILTKEFPDVNLANKPISAISAYDNYTNEYKSFFLDQYKNDKELVEAFAIWINSKRPDLILGWNIDKFDYPYICYSEDTEVLTEKGWMLFKTIVENKLKIKIATLNPKTKQVQYHYPSDYIKQEYSGKMFLQQSKMMDLLVTPNHLLWIKTQHKDFRFIPADHSPRMAQYYKEFSIPNFPYKKIFELPPAKNPIWNKLKKSVSIPMNIWLKFLGFYISEGNLYNNNDRTVAISQSNTANPLKCKKIENILTKLGLGWGYSGHKYTFSNKQIYDYLKPLGLAHNKYIPREFLSTINKRQSMLLLSYLIKGDGHKMGYNNYCYTTVSSQLADDVQELALKSGFVSNISFQKTYYVVSISKQYKYHKPNRQIDNRKYINYSGKVYCLTVPNNLMYIRRNKKTVWCGNCNRFSWFPESIGYLHMFHKKSLHPAGVTILDYMELDKKFTLNRRKSYALEMVAHEDLDTPLYKKSDFSVLSPEIKAKNLEDVRKLVEIEKKKQYIGLVNDMRTMSKCLWDDIYFNSRLIDQLILQESKNKNIVLPNKPEHLEDAPDVSEEKFEGAFRDAFETGLFKQVGKYDLNGAYLYSITDLSLDTANIVTNYPGSIPVVLRDRVTREPIATYYVKQDTKAILPNLARRLINEKIRFKDLLKATDPNAKEYKDIDSQYAAIKSIFLSAWGVIGNRGFRLYDNRIAGMITGNVRDLIFYIKGELNSLGYNVIYIDTDSCFIEDKGKNITPLLNDLIQKWSKERFNKSSSITFEYEGHFNELLIIAKCRYIGNLQTKKGIKKEIKGVEAKRKDSSKWMAKFQEELIDLILKDTSKEDCLKFIEEKKIDMQKSPIEQIAFPCRISPTTEYKNVPIFIRAKEITTAIVPSFNPVAGDNFYYIYVIPEIYKKQQKYLGRKKIDEKEYLDLCDTDKDKVTIKEIEVKSEDNVLAFDEEHKNHIKNIDFSKMEERNILNKIETIFEAMKWEIPVIEANTPKKAQLALAKASRNDKLTKKATKIPLKTEENTQTIVNKEVKND